MAARGRSPPASWNSPEMPGSGRGGAWDESVGALPWDDSMVSFPRVPNHSSQEEESYAELRPGTRSPVDAEATGALVGARGLSGLSWRHFSTRE